MPLRSIALCTALLLAVAAPRAAHADSVDAKANLASFGAGALIVSEPKAYSTEWSGFWLLDEDPSTGWAPPKGELGTKVFVIELADKDELGEVSFDNAGVDGDGGTRGAKDVTVEIGDSATGTFAPLVSATLAKAKDDQHFTAKKPGKGRYLRVSLLSNFGDDSYVELMGFGAYGKVLAKTKLPDVSGVYSTTFSNFRIQATGATATGCYEHKNGLVQNGGFDGRVLRFTWAEDAKGDGSTKESGPAVLVFPSDGKTFLGLWWRGADKKSSGRWDGTLLKTTVGVCPHYKFDAGKSAGGEIGETLRKDGRVRAYGINFDTDSDHLRDESKTTLDQLVAVAKAEGTWKLSIEGHTDSTSSADHNQKLSEARAAAVKAYLVKAGIAADRLSTKGFGATKPVSTNDTSLGRSQNRRVEVVRL
jgi:outer membrane protein OmpA-like peptidoglycan-associated protein